jgi:tetratricopeptide (TPR) repeat protein
MFSFFRSRRPAHRLATSFHWLEPHPLAAAGSDHYSALYEKGGYTLTLRKESSMAWESFSPPGPCADFLLEADVEMDPANGHSAAGVLFRHVDDENFYSFLVSSRGNFRVDLLFNNHPLHLVEWTTLPAADPGADGREAPCTAIRIVGHGSRFSFQVDDEWVAEVDDETLSDGGFGFAAQNFAGAAQGVFRLRRVLVETDPVAVEREHLRASYYSPVSPAARLRFAETLVTMGRFDAAVVQLRKALKDRDGSLRERYLLAQCYARLSLPVDALAEMDRILAREPGYPGARLERANLLYLANRLLEARDAAAAGLADGSIPPTPLAWNLLGNAEYGLGNREAAAAAYQRAIDAEPSELFLRNAARAHEQAGRREQAVALYLQAARLLFSAEAFDELSLLLPRVLALAPRDPDVRAVEGKMLYREGKIDEAFEILDELAEAGTTDSAVHYVVGLIHSSDGDREEALPFFSRAAELEPDYPLYHFRLAETLHMLRRDARPALQRALELAPSDPWANNLAGQMLLEAGDPAAAVEPLRRAREAAPEEEDIALNLAEALSLAGRHEDALAVIGELTGDVVSPGPGASPAQPPRDTARAANLRGNIRARQGDNAAAVKEYETAIRLDPENPEYKENCAAACIEIDMVHRAEELLAQVEPEHPSPSVYNLLGQVAALKGERARGEIAFGQGLALDPGNPDLTMNLALVLRDSGRHERAKALLLELLSAHPEHARAAELLRRIRDDHELRITCANCGREWWAPRSLPTQPSLRIRGDPPAEAPAGRCPRCAKVYCVGCASAHVRDMRFYCPDDGESLKLAEDTLKWLLSRALEAMPAPGAPSTPSAASSSGGASAPDAPRGPEEAQ